MKVVLVSLVTLIICAFIIAGCSTPASTTSVSSPSSPVATKPASAAPTTLAPTTVATTAAPKPQAQYGGILTIINPGTVGTLGFPAESTAGTPNITLPPALEFLTNFDKNMNFLPKLVQSTETEPSGKYITLRLT